LTAGACAYVFLCVCVCLEMRLGFK